MAKKIARDAFAKKAAPTRNIKAAATQRQNAGAAKTTPRVNLTAAASPAGRAVRNRTGPRIAPQAAPSYGGGGGYIGGVAGGYAGGGGLAPMDVAAPETPKRWDELDEKAQADYLKGDATYTAQAGALEQELKNLMAELAMQRTNYETDYGSALTNLGWNADTEAFDPNNMLGAYGMAFSNQQNDFAGRGMLDSSAYANALTDLGTSFDRQRGDLSNARSNFLREVDTRQEGAERTNVQDLQRARADAIARRAAREGII